MIANMQDFEDAKKHYSKRTHEQTTKLSNSDMRLLQILSKLPNHKSTQTELALKMGVSPQRISAILYGKTGVIDGGLLNKVKGLYTQNGNETVYSSDGTQSKTVRVKYVIFKRKYNPFDNYEDEITLDVLTPLNPKLTDELTQKNSDKINI